MSTLLLQTKPVNFSRVIFLLCLCIYLALGINTELTLLAYKPIPNKLLEDFTYYERALDDVVVGKDPYAVRSIGPAYLYPPPALFIVESFHYIKPFYLKSLLYSALNILIMLLIVTKTAKHYGYSPKEVWYWYVFCLGFAPFLELLHLGQINALTLFGIFLLFEGLGPSPALSGFGLSLGILTKVSPIIFVGYLLATRRIKVIIAGLAWMMFITVLGILRYGSTPFLVYPDLFQWLSHQFPVGPNSQSLASKLILEFGFVFHKSEPQLIQSVLMLYIFLVVVTSIILTIIGNQPKEPLFIITAFGMTIFPNVMWYHHYVFILLPILIWMGWMRLDTRIVSWSLLGLMIIQMDRFFLTDGLLIHVFVHLSIIWILVWQAKQYGAQGKLNNMNFSRFLLPNKRLHRS